MRGIVLTGAGDRTFTSGGDLNMLAELAAAQPGEGAAVLDMGDELAICERADVPVIAAVQGDAYGGGCELLLLCDLVIVESHAQLAFRHAKMGLSPAWGGLTRLVERVGPIEAARLLFTAEKIDAAEALRIGLVNEVVPRGAARARAIARVSRIADNPRTSVAALKRAPRGGTRGPPRRRAGARARPLRRALGRRRSPRGDERVPGEEVAPAFALARHASPMGCCIDIIPAGVTPSSAYACSHLSSSATSKSTPSSSGTGNQAPAAISPSSWPGPQPL